MYRFICWFFLSTISFIPPLYGEENPPVAPSHSMLSEMTFGLLLFAIFSLVIWALTKWVRLFQMKGKKIKIIETTSLGSNDRLAIVSVAGKDFLLGISHGHIQNLHTFEHPISIEDPLEQLSPSSPPPLKKGGAIKTHQEKGT